MATLFNYFDSPAHFVSPLFYSYGMSNCDERVRDHEAAGRVEVGLARMIPWTHGLHGVLLILFLEPSWEGQLVLYIISNCRKSQVPTQLVLYYYATQ